MTRAWVETGSLPCRHRHERATIQRLFSAATVNPEIAGKTRQMTDIQRFLNKS
jgi:hypothetical protein